MKALIVNPSGVALRDLPEPSLNNSGDVLLGVRMAGICKTDIAVARGEIRGVYGQPFGHEFSAAIVALGAEVSGLSCGQRVAVNPLIDCQVCAHCCSGDHHLCGDAGLLGVQQPGAFCERICLPASRCHPVGHGISDALAAYAEPVAAMLSVLDLGLKEGMHIAVLGQDRIAELCRFILSTAGLAAKPYATGKFDAIIQCCSHETIPLQALKPGGIIVIKTRLPRPLNLTSSDIVAKRLRIIGANYAKFGAALDYLQQHAAQLQGFIGASFPLADFDQAFKNSNKQKTFFQLCAD